MVSLRAKVSEALFVVSFSIWSRRFLPESETRIEKTVNGVVSVVIFLLDIVDVILDCIFAKSVVDEGESLEWAIVLVVGTLVSHLVDIKSLFLDLSVAENCVTELAAFYLEDVTMIMLIGNVNGAYDPTNSLDVATVWFSAISALVTLFQLGVQMWQASTSTQVSLSDRGQLTRKLGLIFIALLPSCLFLGLLGELLIDDEIVLNQSVVKWICIFAYGLCISFGLVVSFHILIRPIRMKMEPSDEADCRSDESECQTDYELT